MSKEKAGFATLRKMFFTGILFLFPIGVTYWFITWLVEKTQGYARPFVVEAISFIYGEERISSLDFWITLISLTLVLTFILLIGGLANFYIGKKLLGIVDGLLLKLPFVRTIYGGIKQILDAFSLQRTAGSFKKVVLLEYPRTGSWVLGFVTNENFEHGRVLFGRELIAVFVPSTPNPTTGFLLYLDPSELYVLDLDVEEAVKLIVSAGLVLPQPNKKPPNTLAQILGRNQIKTAPIPEQGANP